jgi:hypothetical protein
MPSRPLTRRGIAADSGRFLAKRCRRPSLPACSVMQLAHMRPNWIYDDFATGGNVTGNRGGGQHLRKKGFS